MQIGAISHIYWPKMGKNVRKGDVSHINGWNSGQGRKNGRKQPGSIAALQHQAGFHAVGCFVAFESAEDGEAEVHAVAGAAAGDEAVVHDDAAG